MNIQLDKKNNAVVIEAKETSAMFLLSKVADPKSLVAAMAKDFDIFFVVPESLDATDEDARNKWSRANEKMLPEKVLLVYSAGEYRVKEFHIRAVQDEKNLQFVIETPDAMVGILTGKPSENFIKKYAPLDVVVGEDTVLAESQLDLEPFYVVLTSLKPEYMQQTGITEIKPTDKISIKKIDSSARESGTEIEMMVIHLK